MYATRKSFSLHFAGSLLLICLLTSTLSAGVACSAPTADVHSFGNSHEIRPTHLSLDLALDFERRVITGEVTISFERIADTDRIVLDTRGILIESATGIRADAAEVALTFTCRAPVPLFGSALEIELPADIERVRVRYHTSPGATAVQWLDPAQTAGGKKPFLFTQSQAIHARSWIPCMDSPGVRLTYDATVRVPAGLTAVMSAAPGQAGTDAATDDGAGDVASSDDGSGDDGSGDDGSTAAAGAEERPQSTTVSYRFEMPQPIPSYLLALGVGDLAARDLGPRVRVYAEPAVVESAAYEFADTEKMIQVVEKLYGPYTWGRYDLLILPPSFPFGGMENPRLSFITPTVLAGDRSLVALIAHELAHSWSGNLVTNETWRDFWINEGTTVYVERRIMEALFGREIAEMDALLGYRDLLDDIDALGAEHEFTKLAPELAGHDPDEASTNVPYEKGYLLWRLIEEKVGRKAFDTFLRDLFDRHAFGNLSTEQLAGEIREHLFQGDKQLEAEVRLDEWLYSPGMPDNVPTIRSSEFDKVAAEVERFAEGVAAADLDTEGWRYSHWVQFLRNLPKITAARMKELDDVYHHTESQNSELFFAWSLLAIANDYEAGFAKLELFLRRVGRVKFLHPLYAAMVKNASTLELARRTYKESRPGLHPIAQSALDPLFE